jgi:hypothetical protein
MPDASAVAIAVVDPCHPAGLEAALNSSKKGTPTNVVKDIAEE